MRCSWPGARRFTLAQAADEHVALPPGEDVAGVERQPRQRNRRNPGDDGLLEGGRDRIGDARPHVAPAGG